MEKKLTPKQQAFVTEYLKDLNATQAAIRAGYKKSNARATGAENLTKPDIKAAIDKAMKAREKRVIADADFVLKRLVEYADLDIADIFTEDMDGIRPLQEWPKIWRQAVSHIEVNELFEYMDGKREMVGLLKKIKMPDRLKTLELIGRHTTVKAWDKDMALNADGIEMHLHYG